jgi:exopolysaccharide production protein ExoZ
MYKSIQACRGIASLLVVMFHASVVVALPKYFDLKVMGKIFSFGGSAGVDFFFVLSGFIIVLIHAKDFGQPHRFLRYVAKRLARIYPPYIAVFCGVIAVALLSPALRSALPNDALTMAKALLLIPSEPKVYGDSAPVLVVAWSLQYEMLFYLFVGVAILSRTAALLLGALWCANFLVCLNGCAFPNSFFADLRVWLFVIGALTARLIALVPTSAEGKTSFACGAAVFAFTALAQVCFDFGDLGWQSTAVTLGYGLASGLMIVGLRKLETLGTIIVQNRAFQLLGDGSYALYLVHLPVVSAICKVVQASGLTGWLGGITAFGFCIVVSIGVALIFHLSFERPVLKFLGRTKLSAATPDLKQV